MYKNSEIKKEIKAFPEVECKQKAMARFQPEDQNTRYGFNFLALSSGNNPLNVSSSME